MDRRWEGSYAEKGLLHLFPASIELPFDFLLMPDIRLIRLRSQRTLSFYFDLLPMPIHDLRKLLYVNFGRIRSGLEVVRKFGFTLKKLPERV